MRRKGVVKAGAVTRRLKQSSRVDELLRNENTRHNLKRENLRRQAHVALNIKNDPLRGVVMTRIKGEESEENQRHKARVAELSERRAKIWR